MLDKLKPRMQKIWRQRRMEAFVKLIRPRRGSRVIDLGGLPQMWEMLDLDLDITLLNLPGALKIDQQIFKHQYRLLEVDVCNLMDFKDNEFDIVFSNSVIEHIGPLESQEAFAKTVRRLAPSYWIQTPSIWFPIEAHCNLPFWWFYPSSFKQSWIHCWQQQGREFCWKQMVETRILTLSCLKSFFPEAKVYTEYMAGFPKSYSMYVPNL